MEVQPLRNILEEARAFWLLSYLVPHHSPVSFICRLYLLHREKKDYERSKEGALKNTEF